MTQQRLKTFLRALFPRVRRNYFDELGSWAELWKRLLTITPRPGATRKRCEAEKEVERACRPDSVRRNAGVTIIRLGDRLPGRSSHLPARSGGPPCAVRRPHACLFDVAPDGVWRAGRVATSAVSSYLTISPLPSVPANRHRLGGVLSVPLSVALGLAACCAWPLASILPCGVRTFLRRRRLRAATGDRPTRSVAHFTTSAPKIADGEPTIGDAVTFCVVPPTLGWSNPDAAA